MRANMQPQKHTRVYEATRECNLQGFEVLQLLFVFLFVVMWCGNFCVQPLPRSHKLISGRRCFIFLLIEHPILPSGKEALAVDTYKYARGVSTEDAKRQREERITSFENRHEDEFRQAL
jgi:hypothetical protein